MMPLGHKREKIEQTDVDSGDVKLHSPIQYK